MTTTSFAPAVPDGAMPVISVLLTVKTFVAEEPPIVTVDPDSNAVPVIVNGVPPVVLPILGAMVIGKLKLQLSLLVPSTLVPSEASISAPARALE